MQEARGENGVSFYNLEEAVTVVNYLEKVLKKLGPSGVRFFDNFNFFCFPNVMRILSGRWKRYCYTDTV